MKYDVRLIKPSEYPLLEDFLYEAIFVPEGETPPDRSILRRPALRVYVEGFGAGAADRCVVAEARGRVVGAAWARIMDDYGHVDDDTPSLAVALYPEYRGMGIGTALMEALLSTLARDGYARASLSVQTANRAMRLYERLGFETVENKGGEAIMVRRLDQRDINERRH